MGKHSKLEDNKEKKIKEKKIKKEKIKDDERIDRKPKKKKKGKAKKILLVILLIIVILAGVFGYKVYKNGGGMRGIVTTIIGSNSDQIKNLDDLYVLCLGKSQNMTDTIMIVKYSPKTQKISLLSVPRDSFVGNSTANASAFDKINAKYQLGPQHAIDAVNDLTGLNIKYYVTVDTKALRDLVDTIGGVYFDVPINMDYDDCTQDLAIHLKKGPQMLNGIQAEGVVRFRHNNNGTSYSTDYGDNDLGRMKTQRAFIQTVIKQTLKAENITKINQLMNIAKEEVSTNMSWDVIKNYVAALMEFDTENLKTDMLPGTPTMYNNLSFVVVNKAAARQKVIDMFLTEDNEQEVANTVVENGVANTTTSTSSKTTKKTINSNIKLEVVNGTGSNKKFNDAIAQLQALGYKVTKKGTTNVINKTTIINRNSRSSEEETAIKNLLCTGVVSKGKASNGIDFTIIIGTDY